MVNGHRLMQMARRRRLIRKHDCHLIAIDPGLVVDGYYAQCQHWTLFGGISGPRKYSNVTRADVDGCIVN